MGVAVRGGEEGRGEEGRRGRGEACKGVNVTERERIWWRCGAVR